ncbi:MAG: peptide chain release factor family protein [Pirellula sp.]
MHPSQLPLDELEKACRWTFSRDSGPGGQNRNKVETAASVEHLPTGHRASAAERRSQSENRAVAIHRLRCSLAVAVRSETIHDASAMPSAIESMGTSQAWQQYVRRGRIQISESNPDFPALLAEAMDRLAALDWNVADSAQSLETSGTQLIKLLSQYAPALKELNAQLVARGRAVRNPPPSAR